MSVSLVWSIYRVAENHESGQFIGKYYNYIIYAKHYLGWSKITMWKKLCFQRLKIKQRSSYFSIAKGVVHQKFVLEGQIVTKKFYLEVLISSLKRIACVRPEVWKIHSFNLFHNNVPAHISTILRKKKEGFQCLVTLPALQIWVLWTTLCSQNWKWNWRTTNPKIFSRYKSLWWWNWTWYLFMCGRKQWNYLKIGPKCVFVQMEITLN